MGMDRGRFFTLTSCLFVIATISTIVKAEPGGEIHLQLRSLNNLSKSDNGRCCNSSAPAVCNQLCGNYQFEIWADCDGKRNASTCSYGYNNHVTFDNALEIHNVFIYNFSLFAGTLGLEVLAKDENGSPLESYKHHTPSYPNNYYDQQLHNSSLTSTTSKSTLTISYKVFCNEHYYGPACVVGCLPGRTYTCNIDTGGKLCTAGWLGPNCNCSLTSRNTCNTGTGVAICYGTWYGEQCDVKCVATDNGLAGYTCGGSGEKICLSGWYGTECNETILPSQAPSTEEPTKRPAEQQSHDPPLLPSSVNEIGETMSPSQAPSTEEQTKQPAERQSHDPPLLPSSVNEIGAPLTSTITPLKSPAQVMTSYMTSQTPLHPEKERSVIVTVASSTYLAAQKSFREDQKSTIRPAATVESIVKTTSEEQERPHKTTMNPEGNGAIPTTSSTRTASEAVEPKIPLEVSRVSSVLEAPSSSVIDEYTPGVTETRKQMKDLWWIMLVTLTVLALLTVGGLLMMKYKMRKNYVTHHVADIPLDDQKPDVNGNEVKESGKTPPPVKDEG